MIMLIEFLIDVPDVHGDAVYNLFDEILKGNSDYIRNNLIITRRSKNDVVLATSIVVSADNCLDKEKTTAALSKCFKRTMEMVRNSHKKRSYR